MPNNWYDWRSLSLREPIYWEAEYEQLIQWAKAGGQQTFPPIELLSWFDPEEWKEAKVELDKLHTRRRGRRSFVRNPWE